jgi:FixJ family two-component response regulator
LLARAAQVRASQSSVHRASAKRARNALIAIVDDDPWACDGMNSFVLSLGYSGVSFRSAEEYLRSELKQRTRCLILDVHLKGMSGPELQVRLLADGDRTPIIFVTARVEKHVRDRVMGAGALGYLSKPCDENILLKCLEFAIGV